MLTDIEKAGVRVLLKLLGEDEVLALAKTVTHDQIYFTGAEEAATAIIEYSTSTAELLRRRRLKREILFRYLYNEKVYVEPNADKFTIIQMILKHWKSESVSLTYLMQEEETGLTAGNGTGTEPTFTDTNSTDSNNWNDPSLVTSEADQEMASQFCKWFFQMLNSLNPLIQVNGADRFGPQHFFGDCILRVLSLVNGPDNPVKLDSFVGAQWTVDRLTALVRDEQLILNPNLESSGVRGYSDPYGRRVIMACGTVHRSTDVIGLFELQFVVLRDPVADNNWKIKSVRLAFTASQSINRLPTLMDTKAMLTAS